MTGTLNGAWNAIRTLVSRAKITAAAPGTQRTALQATGYEGEVYAGVALVLPYGMTAIPDSGDILVFRVGGAGDHKVAIGADNPALRITDLGAGELGFRVSAGHQIALRATYVEVTSATYVKVTAAEYVEFDTPLLKCTGDVLDNCNTQTETMAGQRATYDGHNHPIVNVQTGSSTINTGVPNQQET